ncbi:MAG TPA: hypothetical protein VHW43_10950 [Puia sp.]|nr:hypothetical protein [Puia sp.]
MPKEYSRLLLLFLAICLSACQHKTKTVSFYYWRTTYAPDSTEIDALKTNKVHTLYVRYFDVDWSDSDAAPTPLSPIRFDTLPTGYAVVPVIFFYNRVFERLDSAPSHALAEKVLALVRRIDVPAHLNPAETQFDCDWTERSRDNYFRFIRQYHALSGLTLSSTIRLHQIKYSDRTGIPPVDHGILLFYNMGNIDAGTGNSIYDRAVAHRYTPSLRNYPLLLDLALPIFPMNIQTQDGKTKTQHPTADDLLDMVDDVNRHSNQKIRDLIFFDLDRQNLVQYDKGLFEEVLERTE